MTGKRIPTLENETELSTTTNLISSDKLKRLKFVNTVAHPRICLDDGRNIE